MSNPRTSQSLPVVSETPILRLPGAAEEPVRQTEPSPNRRSVIEPGVGCFRIRYRDEYGYLMLDWECDYRVSMEHRDWLQRVQQVAGDDLAASSRPFPLPRLLP